MTYDAITLHAGPTQLNCDNSKTFSKSALAPAAAGYFKL